jgi:hypothetical protein
LFVDGSKFRANAGIKNTWTKGGCAKALKKIDTRIEAILSERDIIGVQEKFQRLVVTMKEELKVKCTPVFGQIRLELSARI